MVAPTLLMLALSAGAALLPVITNGADADPLLRARNGQTVRVIRTRTREC